jgi:hypothetical protein
VPRFFIWLFLVTFIAGCGDALPSSSDYPQPVASAAQPGAEKAYSRYAARGAEAIRKALKDLGPSEALEQMPQKGLDLPDVEVQAECKAAPGRLPTLLCHFGPTAAKPAAQVILWYERDAWRSQLYPQAPIYLAQERKSAFGRHKCAIGCRSGIANARQSADGHELLVVVDMGLGTDVKAEEVQLLRMREGFWEIFWLPGEGDWNYGLASVTLGRAGTAYFRTESSSWLRQDMLADYVQESPTGPHRFFREEWVRKGDAFMLRDRAEEPTPFGSLVRIIHYLNSGADEKARALMAKSVAFEKTKEALKQRPRHQRWPVERKGDGQFRLIIGDDPNDTLLVDFRKAGNDWILTNLQRTEPAGGARP